MLNKLLLKVKVIPIGAVNVFLNVFVIYCFMFLHFHLF